ncbi:uncharacterized protein LOC123943442 isoform X2 [Meles meles]|uniref:uncharacterized protein LOC123943442 isoform X2 n=1 Tax=Meles meles TaxID=9662 RepID=UPI001E69EF4D|nr:uncharacterized protein LOC123943442 isoform X2 [Meles meles]
MRPPARRSPPLHTPAARKLGREGSEHLPGPRAPAQRSGAPAGRAQALRPTRPPGCSRAARRRAQRPHQAGPDPQQTNRERGHCRQRPALLPGRRWISGLWRFLDRLRRASTARSCRGGAGPQEDTNDPPAHTPAFLLGVSTAACAVCPELTSLVSTDRWKDAKDSCGQPGPACGGTLSALPPEHSTGPPPRRCPQRASLLSVSPHGPPHGAVSVVRGGVFLLEHEERPTWLKGKGQ